MRTNLVLLIAVNSHLFRTCCTIGLNVTSGLGLPCGAPCPANGPCCSRWGFCGATEAHCSVAMGCQSGCWTEKSAAPKFSSITVPKIKILKGEQSSSSNLPPDESDPEMLLLPWDPLFVDKGWPSEDELSSYDDSSLTLDSDSLEISPSMKFRKEDFDSPLIGHPDENPHFDERGLFSSCVPKGVISLTFDDGPSAVTEGILDTLKAFPGGGIKATFFVIGKNAEKRPDLVKRIINDGHVLGLHTWSHPDLTTLSDSDVKQEMRKTQDLIFSIAGVRPIYMRPPYGALDDRVKNILWRSGFKIIMWNLDTNDWKYHHSEPKKIFQAFQASFTKHKSVRLARSWIPLQHDLYDGTLQQQKQIIEFADKMGYVFVPLNECLRDPDSPYR
jgi:peptidoglycan/xylan/chitin deacetylase (PgdA/CDA1 family)